MPTTKPTKVLLTAVTKPFSLVPASAQQQMYKVLAAQKRVERGKASGAEVAEIAVCVAIGENDTVILACPASGARAVRKGCRTVGTNGRRLTAATIAAVSALLNDATAIAVICLGKLEAKEDYRGAFSFAARHKLPILFVVANCLTPGRPHKLDLGNLNDEFGIPVFSVDATDAIAVYRVTTEALHNARHLRGPCIIEALTVNGKGSNRATTLDLLQGYMERHGNWPL